MMSKCWCGKEAEYQTKELTGDGWAFLTGKTKERIYYTCQEHKCQERPKPKKPKFNIWKWLKGGRAG